MRVRGWASTAVLVLVVGSVAGAVWHRVVPGIGLLDWASSRPAVTTSGNGTGQPEQAVTVRAGDTVPAVPAVTQLLETLPAPDQARWKPSSETLRTPGTRLLGNVLDQRCPSAAAPVPVVARNKAWTGTSQYQTAGLVVEVAAYPAGLAAAAVKRMQTRAVNCPGIRVSTSPAIGDDTLAFTDDGGVDGSGPDGHTLIVRVSDIVAVLTVRGSYLDLTAWAETWIQGWAAVLAANGCTATPTTTADAARSPLSGHYEGLATTSSLVQLTQAQLDGARIRGLSGAGLPAGTSTPTTAETSPPVATPNSYPAAVRADLPQAPAKPGTEPAFPTPPSTSVTVSSYTSDPTGPGCGWAFTGLAAPVFNRAAETQSSKTRDTDQTNRLLARWATWYVKAARYLQRHDAWVAQVRAWNSWVQDADRAAAGALWKQYDTDKTAYDTAYSQWLTDHTAWAALPECVTDPAAGAVGAVCPAEPVAPTAPREPTVPRP